MSPFRLTRMSAMWSALSLGLTSVSFGLLSSMLGPHAAAAQSAAKPQIAAAPVVAGWIERISFPDQGLLFEAKLDTGADSSSLNGRNVKMFRKAGRSFVTFDIVDDTGKTAHVEEPVVRRVRVKRAGGENDSRAVVRLKVCVGGKVAEADFTIADRVDLNYQVLIGRNMMAGRILVDSGRQRIVSDLCQPPS